MKFKSIIQLFKLRLSYTVVLSSLLGYLIAVYKAYAPFYWSDLGFLFVGGLLITCAANGFNQIIEKEQDTLMKRTQNRPLVTNQLSISFAFAVSTIVGILGFIILFFGNNALTGIIGIISLVLYSFVYTPSKKYTSFCVLIGAIPGALPPLIGYVAAANTLDTWAIYLFVFQFLWQFPHFWAIAWQLHEDYQKAGYHMLPTASGKTKKTSMIILIYTVITFIVSLLPFFLNQITIIGLILIIITGGYFIYKNIQLYQTLENKHAKQLMFASLIFMPTVLTVLIF